jgi:hypothetical protein
VVTDGGDLGARVEAQYGAWLCGAVLAATTTSLHHKLCHTLGGTLDLPHAQTHTVVLPHALAYNQPAAPEAVAALSRALGGVPDPARQLWESEWIADTDTVSGTARTPSSSRTGGSSPQDHPPRPSMTRSSRPDGASAAPGRRRHSPRGPPARPS